MFSTKEIKAFYMGKWKHWTWYDMDTDMDGNLDMDMDMKTFFLYLKHVACILRVNYTSALKTCVYKMERTPS